MVIAIPSEVSAIIDTLEKAGFRAYLVGGSVRDILLGRNPKDYDIATDAVPTQVKGLFERAIKSHLSSDLRGGEGAQDLFYLFATPVAFKLTR